MPPHIRELLARVLLSYGREKVSWRDFDRERRAIQKTASDGESVAITSLRAGRYITTNDKLEDIQLTDFAIEQLTKGE